MPGGVIVDALSYALALRYQMVTIGVSADVVKFLSASPGGFMSASGATETGAGTGGASAFGSVCIDRGERRTCWSNHVALEQRVDGREHPALQAISQRLPYTRMGRVAGGVSSRSSS